MSTWPDLGAFEILVAIADHGSLAGAARAAGVAQPNASRSIQRLERRLGLALVTRSTHGSKLTPAGLLVVEWARPALAAARTLLDAAAGLATSESTPLRVSASQTVAEHLLPTWIATLQRTTPTKIEVHVGNSSDVVTRVKDGRDQVGFVEGPARPTGVHSIVVAYDELVLVVAPSHPWTRRRSPVSLDDVAATPLVTREAGSGTRIALDALLAGRGPAQSYLELGSNAAVRVGVAAGAAPAVLSRLAVDDALRRGELVQIPVADFRGRRALRAVWAGPRQLTGAAAALVTTARATASALAE